MDEIKLGNIILEEIRAVRAELKDTNKTIQAHIHDEALEFKSIRKEVAEIKSATLLNGQKIKTAASIIALIVSAAVTWLSSLLGIKA